MRRLLVILAVVVFHGISFAQFSNGNTISFTGSGDPTGGCSFNFRYVNASNGNLYDCLNGAWNLVSGAGGSGTVTSVTFTGDGVVLSSTPSTAVITTGTLLAALKTQAAHTVLGNNTASTAAPAFNLPGILVNAQSGNYTLDCASTGNDRAAYIKFSGGTTATLTLGQITTTCASNLPFVAQNLNSGNLTITANAADKIDNGSTGGSITVLPNYVAFVYQDSSSAPGNWWSIQLPNAAASGINATSASYIAGGGTAQAQTATFVPALTALTTGATGKFLPTAANTAAAPTLAVNGLTAKNITKCGTVALIAADLITTSPAEVTYDGTEWVLQNPQAATCQKTPNGVVFSLFPGGAGAISKPAGNATLLWAFAAPLNKTSSTKLGISVQTADNTSNLNNFAIFDGAGNMLCQTGAIAGNGAGLGGTTGPHVISWSGSCGPFTAGTEYYFAQTLVTSTLVLGGQTNSFSPLCATAPSSNSTTSSAVWTVPIGIPADSAIGTCANPQINVY